MVRTLVNENKHHRLRRVPMAEVGERIETDNIA